VQYFDTGVYWGYSQATGQANISYTDSNGSKQPAASFYVNNDSQLTVSDMFSLVDAVNSVANYNMPFPSESDKKTGANPLQASAFVMNGNNPP
jgi:hypothetical protein